MSPYLTEELRAGDEIEVRGPIGGYFVWDVEHGGPLLLVAGGSGIVPLRAMLRHRRRSESDVPVRLLYSSRRIEDVIYRAELDEPAEGSRSCTLTREQPPGWTGHTGRVDPALLEEVAWPADADPLAFVCGPTSFVETVAGGLVGLGYAGSGEDGAVRSDGTLMEALDGNAIGGLLLEVFGAEMTNATGICALRRGRQLATWSSTSRAPGTVARCRVVTACWW